MRALITQREEYNKYGDLTDSLEASYVKYFADMGITVCPVSNFTDNLNELLDCCWDLIILSGGGILPQSVYSYDISGFQQENRNRVEEQIIEYSLKKGIPILGICRGMQKLNTYFGGKISSLCAVSVERPLREEHTVKFTDGSVEIMVNNFHKDGIFMDTDLGKSLIPVAVDEDNGIVEAFKHSKYRVFGLQWHPERVMNETGNKVSRKMIEKFISGADF